MAAAQPACPKDAEAMDSILRDMGVQDYEPRVINQLLDFAYRYSTDILSDARGVSEHAGKRVLDEDDIRFAISSRAENSFSRPPPLEVIMEQAKERNSAPLLPLKQQYGMRLPPDRHCLLHPNYRMKNRRFGPTIRTSMEEFGSRPVQSPSAGGLFRVSTAPSATNFTPSNLMPKKPRMDLDEDYDK